MGRKHKNKKKKLKRAKRLHQLKNQQVLITGKLSVAAGGFGFVKVDLKEESAAGESQNQPQEYFIPPKKLNGALHGDMVDIVEIEDSFRRRGGNRGPVAKVVNIAERGKKKLVGELLAGHKVRPLSKNYPDDIPLKGGLADANRGDWVEVDLQQTGKQHGKALKGTVSSIIGKCGEIEHDLNAVIAEYELEPPYSEAENNQAAELQALDIKREDATDRFCVTVDPVDAKDRDDAVSLKQLEDNQWELGVHIADVAAWIRPGSVWDQEAAKRAFTSYLPGKTLPMLPKSLTALISLSDDRPCPAHSVFMTIDGESGKILNSRRCHTTINVASNLNFDQIDAFIDGKPDADWDDNFAQNIDHMIKLVRKMRDARRKAEKFLELATTEIRVLCDDKTKEIFGLKKEIQTEADTLIEDCMLAANTEVAKELIDKSIPGMYRVHPEPDPEKLEEFSSFMYQTFDIFPGDLTSRQACNAFLKGLPDDHKKPVIVNAFLRTLPRASYSHDSSIHFGLGKMKYSHFTSPIRRYPDLIVHQQLWAADQNERMKSKKKVEKIAEDCTSKEANNDEAYYAANDRLKLHYLKGLVEKDASVMHEAIITKVTSGGFLVDVPDLGIYGFVEREVLGGLYRKKGGKFISVRGHQEFCCGDFIYVRLERIDMVRGQAVFRPVI